MALADLLQPGHPAKPSAPSAASTSAPPDARPPAVPPAAKPSGPAHTVEIRQLRDSLYVLTGSGLNTLAFVTTQGVVLVDTRPDGWSQAVLDKIRTVTSKPVTTVIDTDAGADHTGGNAFFAPTAEIVAQENTRANLQRSPAFRGDHAAGLPQRTYADRMTLFTGADRVDLLYLGAGHTDGDTWVVFPALRIAYAGDMFPGKMPPVIDAADGGSAVALPQTLDRAAAEIKDVDFFVTGRSSPVTPAELKDYARFNRDFLAAVQKAAKGGKSVDEIAVGWTMPDRYKDYTAPPARVRANVRAIVSDSKTEKPRR